MTVVADKNDKVAEKQMFNKLNLAVNPGDLECTTNQTEIENGVRKCPLRMIAVPFFQAVYMLLANVLLINLLIAMFRLVYLIV